MKIQVLLALFMASFHLNAQIKNPEKLDEYFNTLEKNNKFMGSVAIAKEGKLIYKKSIGFGKVKEKSSLNENSKFRIGSISKTLTATLVMMAIEQGKLSLDDKLSKFYPSINNAKEITVLHLLSHQSGIHNFTNDPDYLSWHEKAQSRKEMVNLIKEKGSDFKPGEKSEYSNSNYVLLSYILEDINNSTFENLVKKYISEPLNLKHTYFGGELQSNECLSYSFKGEWEQEPSTHLSVPMGAGSIISNPIDLVKFSNALFTGKLVNNKSLEEMQKLRGRYGLGLFTFPFNDKIGYGHTGGIDGFTSVFTYFPNEKIAYSLTSNGTNYNNNEISITVLKSVFGMDFEIPIFNSVSLSNEELKKYSGEYSSPQIPLKLTISVKNNTLIAQGEGQPSFPLETKGNNRFINDMIGLELIFNPSKNEMTLNQGGGSFIFTR
jgi:CubicO group peptidase (beta-lactamase class C family)